MTPAGHEQLRREWEEKKTERHRVVEIVAWAASNGDRSENADYKEGKRRLREIDRRLRFLQRRLAYAEVVDPAAQRERDRVYFGATVTYATEADERRTVTIVGVDEADMAEAKVSVASPVARALLRARVGDEVRRAHAVGAGGDRGAGGAVPGSLTPSRRSQNYMRSLTPARISHQLTG